MAHLEIVGLDVVAVLDPTGAAVALPMVVSLEVDLKAFSAFFACLDTVFLTEAGEMEAKRLLGSYHSSSVSSSSSRKGKVSGIGTSDREELFRKGELSRR